MIQLPLLIAEPVPAFMEDTAMVAPYAQCVAKGFVLLITTSHGFRYVRVYVYKDEHTLSRSRSASRHRSGSRGNCSYLLCRALSS